MEYISDQKNKAGMKKTLVLIALFLLCSPAYAAFSFLGVGTLTNVTSTAGSQTFGTPCTGSNLLGIVVGNGGVTNDNWTTVTWGGSAMTKVATEIHTSGDRWEYEYYILNPPSGSQTITVNGTPSDHIAFTPGCYSGISSFDSGTSAGSTNTSVTASFTTTVANELVVGNLYGAVEGGCTAAHTTTGINRVGNGGASVIDNTSATPASVSIVCNPASSQGWAALIGGFIPTVTALSAASTKTTINGIQLLINGLKMVWN